MKILMAAMSMGLGGAETHVLELSRALAARGHDVTVASAGGAYARELAKYGVKHAKVPLHSKNPTAVAKAALLLSRLMEEEQFDIVHAHARIPAFICGRLKRKYGFAFITTAHFDFVVNPLLRKITDWGERVLAVSADIAESVAKKYGYPREKISLVNNGIDTERFSPENDGAAVREHLGLVGKKVIMYLGRLDDDSFLPAQVLLDAAEAIFLVHRDARVVIVGNGKKYAELAAKARALNKRLGAEIALLPGGTAKAAEYIAACDAFVGPSRSAMEALASGKPTIVAGNFGMLGTFSPEVAGEALRTNFCCRGSAPATAERVRECVLSLFSLSESERAAVSSYGREFIGKHYSAAAMADVCEAEYRALLAELGKKAVICGYYGAENIGDEAMLGALVSTLKKSKSVKKITVLSANPAWTAARFGVCAVPCHDMAKISRALAEADALIFGGGNILQDKTSTRSLVYYTHIACLAKKHACKVAFSANGIGPIVHKGNLALVKKALLCADYISMREENSRRLAATLTGRSDIFDSGELAFACESAEAKAGGERYFAVFPKLVENFHFEELGKFCAYMKRRHGLSPVFAPMHKGEDARLCRMLAQRIRGAVYVNASGEREIYELIRGAAFTVCMRLHAAVFSVAARVPAISVSDDGKLASFLKSAGGAAFGADAAAGKLAIAAREALEKYGQKQKLLGEFAEEQRRLASAELERICELLNS